MQDKCLDCNAIITGRGKTKKCRSCSKKGSIPYNKNIKNIVKCKFCNKEENIDKFQKTKNGYRNICIECYSNWQKNYGKKYKERRNKLRKERRKKDINYRLKNNIGNILRKKMKNVKNKKESKTEELIGYNVLYLKEHLEKQFDENMNWDNYGIYWNIDHIIPQSFFNFSKNEEIKKCWLLTNLRPLKVIDNIIKSNKIGEFNAR